jgi:hypothetical protein
MKEKIYINNIKENKIKNRKKTLQVQLQLSFSLNNFGVHPSASSPGDGVSDVVL